MLQLLCIPQKDALWNLSVLHCKHIQWVYTTGNFGRGDVNKTSEMQ
jgi:hypothetical protein